MTAAKSSLGFFVLCYEHGQWKEDWDGQIHPTKAGADTSAAEANRAHRDGRDGGQGEGWTVVVVELVQRGKVLIGSDGGPQ